MGKQRKTLREKKLAELRHQKHARQQITPGPSIEEATQPVAPSLTYTFQSAHQTKKITAYSLQHDLIKTLGVSAGIIVFQLLLFILLHNHALVLPLVSLRY